MGLDRCASCNRHVRADAPACPFCRAARGAGLFATGLTALALTGCPSEPPPAPVYGAPPSPAVTEPAPPATEPAPPATEVAPPTSSEPRPQAPVYGAPPPPDEPTPR